MNFQEIILIVRFWVDSQSWYALIGSFLLTVLSLLLVLAFYRLLLSADFTFLTSVFSWFFYIPCALSSNFSPSFYFLPYNSYPFSLSLTYLSDLPAFWGVFSLSPYLSTIFSLTGVLKLKSLWWEKCLDLGLEVLSLRKGLWWSFLLGVAWELVSSWKIGWNWGDRGFEWLVWEVEEVWRSMMEGSLEGVVGLTSTVSISVGIY